LRLKKIKRKENNMADMNLSLDYFGHRKSIRLIVILGKGAELLPIKLWCYVGKYHAENGILMGYSESEIEKIIEWHGEKGAAVKAMEDVGFIKKYKKFYKIINWSRHNGHLENFKKRAKKAAKTRWKDIKEINAKTDYKPKYTDVVVDKKVIKFDFDALWILYPNKDGKKDSMRHMKASIKTSQDYLDCKKAIENYTRCRKVKDGYIKMGSTFFRNWKDWTNPTDVMLDGIVKDKTKREEQNEYVS
jgi:hypothetical protein